MKPIKEPYSCACGPKANFRPPLSFGSPLIRRLPKVGFRSKRPILNQVVNCESLNRFEKGAVVNAESLKAIGLIKSLNKPFKILGNGEVKKSLVIETESISKTAREKVEKAGGQFKAQEKEDKSKDK